MSPLSFVFTLVTGNSAAIGEIGCLLRNVKEMRASHDPAWELLRAPQMFSQVGNSPHRGAKFRIR